MKSKFNFHQIKVLFFIFLPIILFLSYFFYDKHATYISHIKIIEKDMAEIILANQAFIENRINSEPLLLNQDIGEIQEHFLISNLPHGVHDVLLDVSVGNLSHLAMGIYSYGRKEIVFHIGIKNVYEKLDPVSISAIMEKRNKKDNYIKFNNHILYTTPIYDDQNKIKGFIYTYNKGIDNTFFRPYMFLGILILAFSFAAFGAKWVEDKTQKRIEKLKQELESIKDEGKLLTVKNDNFSEIVKKVNDLKEHLINEQEFQLTILDGLPIGIIFYDKDGQVAFVNKTAMEITGYSKEEIKQFTVVGNILDYSQYVFWETLQSGESFLGFESYCPTKDGNEIPVMTSTKPLYKTDNEFIGIVSSFIDISEQDRLRKEEQHAKVMLDNISDGVIRVDNHGVINGFNRGAEEMAGLKAADVLGKKYDDVFIKRKTIFTKLTQTLDTGKEYTNYKKVTTLEDGRSVYLMITTKILRDDYGKQIGAMAIYKDITQLEEFAQRMQRYDKLAVVGELAAGTAHEIRNPLTTIKGFVQLLNKELKNPQNQLYLTLILEEIDHINEIIKEMLLLAKPGYPRKSPVSLNNMIRETVSFMQTEGDLYNIQFTTDLEENIPNFDLDERQVKQVFINIIRNSIQSMKNNGTIKITSYFNKERQGVEVIFIDEGEGIPEEKMPKIFDPFFTTKEEGTGLGIPVSCRIMKSHGGDLQINSKVGKGTKVTLFFPDNTD